MESTDITTYHLNAIKDSSEHFLDTVLEGDPIGIVITCPMERVFMAIQSIASGEDEG